MLQEFCLNILFTDDHCGGLERLDERSRSFAVLWNAQDVDKLVDIYTRDGILMLPGSPALTGKERE